MTAKVEGQDLYLLLEREVRTPKERLLIDAFLPPPEALPSALRRPVPPRPDREPARDPEPAAAATRGLADIEDLPEEAPAPPPRRRAARRAVEPEKSLEEEIAEFMSRSSRALAPDSDPEAG